MRGLLAPQNTFLDTIATRFDGTRESDLRPVGSQRSSSLPGFPQVPHPDISAWRPLFSPSLPNAPLLAGTTISFQTPFLKDSGSTLPQVRQNGRKSPGLGPRMPFVGEGANPDLVGLTQPIPVSGAILQTTMEVAGWGLRQRSGVQGHPEGLKDGFRKEVCKKERE